MRTKKTNYDINYAKENLKRVSLNMRNEEYKKLKDHCDTLGIPVSTFLKIAAKEKMERG